MGGTGDGSGKESGGQAGGAAGGQTEGQTGSQAGGVRLDKWLNAARVFKTRTQATHACSLGRVRVNGAPAKAHRAVAVGDRIEVVHGDRERILEIAGLRDKPVAKAEARELYVDHSPPPPPRDSLERLLKRPPVQREKGSGRPTKRERREIDRFRGDG